MKKIQINLVGIRQKHNKVKNENASKLARTPLRRGARFKGVSDMNEPNYENCTHEELIDILNHIDKEAYPERFNRINLILNDPKKVQKLKIEQAQLDLIKDQKYLDEKVWFKGLLMILQSILVILFGLSLIHI